MMTSYDSALSSLDRQLIIDLFQPGEIDAERLVSIVQWDTSRIAHWNEDRELFLAIGMTEVFHHISHDSAINEEGYKKFSRLSKDDKEFFVQVIRNRKGEKLYNFSFANTLCKYLRQKCETSVEKVDTQIAGWEQIIGYWGSAFSFFESAVLLHGLGKEPESLVCVRCAIESAQRCAMCLSDASLVDYFLLEDKKNRRKQLSKIRTEFSRSSYFTGDRGEQYDKDVSSLDKEISVLEKKVGKRDDGFSTRREDAEIMHMASQIVFDGQHDTSDLMPFFIPIAALMNSYTHTTALSLEARYEIQDNKRKYLIPKVKTEVSIAYSWLYQLLSYCADSIYPNEKIKLRTLILTLTVLTQAQMALSES